MLVANPGVGLRRRPRQDPDQHDCDQASAQQPLGQRSGAVREAA